MIVNQENMFLLILGLIWIVGAILQDLKRREVDNFWNFSLIGFALAYRAFYSINTGEYWFLLNGVIGFLIFLILGNLFYYLRLFAGGDAKLVIALGTILPLSYDWIINFKIFGIFIFSFLISGAIYVLIWSLVLVIINYKAFALSFVQNIKKKKNYFYLTFIITFFWIVVVVMIEEYFLLLISISILLFPILFVFAKAVEESCLIKKTDPLKLTEGDWLSNDILVNGKKIKASWDGLSKNDIKLIRSENKKVMIKNGIPFTPSFLFAIIILIILDLKFGLF